jgi:hypothetical protein
VKVGAVRSVVFEARRLAQEIQEEAAPASTGPILVSGMLCEQLAKELSVGAEPGAVVVDGETRLPSADVAVHVIAREPSPGDEALVRAADRHQVPVVLVQLWPQEDWTPPFVLTPFVVECRAGHGFPIDEIARRVAEATENAPALARRVPVLRDAVTASLVGSAVVRSALVGIAGSAIGASRPVLALEQVRLLSRLRSLQGGAPPGELPVVAGIAAAAVGLSFGLRSAARGARRSLPAPLVNAALAAASTWALSEAIRRLDITT